MKLNIILPALLVAVLGYLVVRYELWDKKYLVIAPLYFRTQVYLRITAPIFPSSPVVWKEGSSRLHRRQVEGIHSSVDTSSLPNIILIISDDLGLNDLSGGCGVKTPNIDSIRHNGVAFMQAYAGQATCAPSRGAMLTGRFPTRFGYEFTPGPKGLARILTVPKDGEVFPPILHQHLIEKLPPVYEMSLTRNETLISEVLQENGYDTYYLGKWDSGPRSPHTPVDRGYNESLNFYVGASLYQRDWHPDLINGYGDKFDDFLRLICRFYVSHNNKPYIEPDKYMTDYLSEQTRNLIMSRAIKTDAKSNGDSAETNVGKEKTDPFFITLAYNAPHNPYQAMRADYEDPEVQKLPTHMERVYAAMVKALDRGVGTVLQALKDSGHHDNTIVIFTNDNGGAHYANLPQLNAPFRGWKATFFEGGIRVPMFMQWPARIQPLHDPATGPAGPADPANAEICASYARRAANLGVDCGYRVVDDVVSHVDLFTSLVSLVQPQPASTTHNKLDGLNFFDLIRAQGGWLENRPGSQEDAQSTDSSLRDAREEENERAYKAAKNHSQTRALYWRSGHYSAVRVGDWKLQMALRPDKVWFYDLHSDPTERRNLAAEVGVTNRASLEALRDRRGAVKISNITTAADGTANSDVDGSVENSAEGSAEGSAEVSAEGSAEGSVLDELLRVFAEFVAVESEQVEASWPAASETPVTVDKIIGAQQEPSDECIYWSN